MVHLYGLRPAACGRHLRCTDVVPNPHWNSLPFNCIKNKSGRHLWQVLVPTNDSLLPVYRLGVDYIEHLQGVSLIGRKCRKFADLQIPISTDILEAYHVTNLEISDLHCRFGNFMFAVEYRITLLGPSQMSSARKHALSHEVARSSFESFLEEAGIAEEVHAIAIARVAAWQSQKSMRALQKEEGASR